jgi:IS30 family transposase
MGKHFSHLTPTQRTQIDAFRRAGMKVVDIAKEVGVHYTTIYRELKRCTYEHLNSDYTVETRYNPDGAQARYEANLRAKGPELKIGNDYELADYLIGKIRDEKYSPEAAIGEAEVMGWPFRVHICASTAYNYIRGEIIVPMKDKTSESVVRALNGIERKLGALFPRIFVTITCDNGTEFADAEGIESKRRGKGKRTTVYYCHPYTPSERGTNENQNGLIRRLVPKGTDLATLSPQEVKAAEAWLNSYPRKMFGFLCSEQLFREELALILAR